MAAAEVMPTLLELMNSRRQAHVDHEILLVSSPGFGVLDSGCGKTIIGENTLKQFQHLWKQAGISEPREQSEMNQFRFGNGEVETSSRLVNLPIGLAGKKGIIQAAVVKGSAPLLVSRPALKRLGATINFAEDSLRLFHGQLDVPLHVNAAGQYTVDVMQFSSDAPVMLSSKPAAPAVLPEEPSSDLASEVAAISCQPCIAPHDPKDPVNSDSPSPIVPEVLANTAEQPSIPHSVKTGGISKKQLRKIKSRVNQGLTPLCTKYAVVEIFCPRHAAPEVKKMGLRGLSIDKTLGWDLLDTKQQDWLLREMREFPPELMILCPPCTDAGGWFHLNKFYMSIQEYLKRKHQLRKFKEFCKKLIKQQVACGGRFIFEHPAPSEVWSDPDFIKLRNDLCSFTTDMCCFDLHVPAVETQPKQLIRKTTRLLVSHEDMKEYLQRRCPGEGCSHHAEHAKIAGSHPAVGKVSRHAGVYTPQFVRAMLDSVRALRAQEVLIIDEEPNHVVTSEVLATEEEKSASDEKLIAVLRRLHNNLGHPSKGELIRVLKHGQASERALALAAKLSCSTCESLKAPAIPNPAAVSHVSVFNHKIGIDVKHLQGWRVNHKIRALNIVDYASNFQLMIPFFETETAVLLRQLLNDRWLSWAGPPREIVLDPARTNLGKALTEPCELEGSHVSIIAAGAHWQLGKTEVHGGLFAKVLSRVLEERSPQTKEEWLDCVRHCHIKNSTIQTHGFTPSQVEFGKNPEIPGELLNEPQHVVPCTASLLEDSVERAQSIRYSAKKAILEMQDDRSMRRALAARPRLARNFRVGDVT